MTKEKRQKIFLISLFVFTVIIFNARLFIPKNSLSADALIIALIAVIISGNFQKQNDAATDRKTETVDETARIEKRFEEEIKE